ncbi:hypothetical protein LshimejAT787_0901730 [Lyophyllum shimeji]|uniref:F-box domain-containing protein n=1 Tax=Lyophyllum shimeji TaxID=47721 RepID=A0A9P3UPS3_LYOSH|nr:hypothetical protein LshimejAT787_0901730 [Lyophyllum shimeji]
MGGIRRVPGLEIANAAQREIDEQLATLLDNVCVLKRQRNAYAYISRLPSEILCRIFEIARDTDHLRHPRPESCVIITHVCSAWRDIAIRFPGLWNRITPNYRFPWVEEMMCSLLLDRLALIPTSNIRLECSTHEEPFGRPPHLSFSSLSNLLRLQHGTEREAGSILSAEWTFDRTSFMTLALWRETRPTYGKPFLELVLPVYAPNLVAIPAVLGALPLDALDHISFFQDFPQAWISALTPFERVTSVFIRDIEPGAGIVAALAHPTPTPTVGRSEETPLRFLFPALANLTISQCSLLNGLCDHEHTLFAELYAMLETRRGNGCGIATLMLKACEVTEVQLMKLRQVVGTVVCHREDLNTVVVASPDGIDGERFD